LHAKSSSHNSRDSPYEHPVRKPAAKPFNPYDDPDRISRRDQRRKDFAHRRGSSKSSREAVVDEAPPDMFTGGDDSPVYHSNVQLAAPNSQRGPRTPDLNKDPLGLTENLNSSKVTVTEDRFREKVVKKTEDRFSTSAEMAAGRSKSYNTNKEYKGSFEEQQLKIAAMMTKGYSQQLKENPQSVSEPIKPQLAVPRVEDRFRSSNVDADSKFSSLYKCTLLLQVSLGLFFSIHIYNYRKKYHNLLNFYDFKPTSIVGPNLLVCTK